MAEAKGTSALAAYKAGLKDKKSNVKRRKVTYFPIGRTLAVIAGVFKLVKGTEVSLAMKNLERGDLAGFSSRMAKAFDTTSTERIEGIKIVSTGVILGKSLDAAKVNPKVKLIGSFGIKLV